MQHFVWSFHGSIAAMDGNSNGSIRQACLCLIEVQALGGEQCLGREHISWCMGQPDSKLIPFTCISLAKATFMTKPMFSSNNFQKNVLHEAGPVSVAGACHTFSFCRYGGFREGLSKECVIAICLHIIENDLVEQNRPSTANFGWYVHQYRCIIKQVYNKAYPESLLVLCMQSAVTWI